VTELHLITSQPRERDECRDVVAHGSMDGAVAHDPFLHTVPARLELRLDQRDELSRPAQQPIDRRQHQLERDEADVDDGEIAGSARESSARMSVCSSETTPGSSRNFGCNCPRPTSIA
jgi:hypothetical protein